jgi:hypothetical protein
MVMDAIALLFGALLLEKISHKTSMDTCMGQSAVLMELSLSHSFVIPQSRLEKRQWKSEEDEL